MTEIEEKLVRCFQAVFPGLSSAQIRNASSETLSDWNSLSAVTLVSVVEEEFGISIGMTDLVALDSFRAFQQCVAAKTSAARAGL